MREIKQANPRIAFWTESKIMEAIRDGEAQVAGAKIDYVFPEGGGSPVKKYYFDQ